MPHFIKDFITKTRARPDAQPIFQKARPVSYALKKAVDKELDRIEETKITTNVERSD